VCSEVAHPVFGLGELEIFDSNQGELTKKASLPYNGSIIEVNLGFCLKRLD
jgi:hypothetical protein